MMWIMSGAWSEERKKDGVTVILLWDAGVIPALRSW